MGTTAAGVLLWFIPMKEGTKYKAYRDSVGVLTICEGDTAHVKVGEVDGAAQCQDRLQKQLLSHAQDVMTCIPTLREEGKDYARVIVSLAYNVGGPRVCHSVAANWMRDDQWLHGCEAMQVYDKAGGLTMHGLEVRRQQEVQICLTNIVPGFTPENLRQRVLAIH